MWNINVEIRERQRNIKNIYDYVLDGKQVILFHQYFFVWLNSTFDA